MHRLLTAFAALALSAPLFAADGHHHGDKVALGTKAMGDWQVTANRIGAWEAGTVGAGSVDLVPAQPAAKAVRVWIGGEDGKGAAKAKGEAETAHPGGWHCHLEVPNPLPAGAQFWVAIETADGKQLKESFPLAGSAADQPATAPAKAEGAGHDHGPGGHTH